MTWGEVYAALAALDVWDGAAVLALVACLYVALTVRS